MAFVGVPHFCGECGVKAEPAGSVHPIYDTSKGRELCKDCHERLTGPPRYKLISIPAMGRDGVDYVVRDTTTGDNISDYFESREAAEHWLAITGLQ